MYVWNTACVCLRCSYFYIVFLFFCFCFLPWNAKWTKWKKRFFFLKRIDVLCLSRYGVSKSAKDFIRYIEDRLVESYSYMSIQSFEKFRRDNSRVWWISWIWKNHNKPLRIDWLIELASVCRAWKSFHFVPLSPL